jgi:hypothetical protein
VPHVKLGTRYFFSLPASLFEKDLYHAIKEDGLKGALMTLPGAFGIGV